MRAWAAVWAATLAGCSPAPGLTEPSADLEQAAIARGVIRDPSSLATTGLYSREGDRLCMAERDGVDRIGAFVDYGDGIGCTGRGDVRRTGETLSIDFGGGCAFVADFDGDRLRFPGALPSACEPLCRGRASFAGLDLQRLSDSRSEAEALRDRRGQPLCG